MSYLSTTYSVAVVLALSCSKIIDKLTTPGKIQTVNTLFYLCSGNANKGLEIPTFSGVSFIDTEVTLGRVSTVL